MTNFDKALLEYLKSEDKNILESLLLSPNLIIDSKVIPMNHILLDEAMIILDSLSSYNKRISNEERELELLEIPESSPLYSWRCGALAIKEFYNQNQYLVTNYLNEINENSPLQKLKLYILKNKETALFTQDINLNSSVDALKEVINNELIDMYPQTVKLLLEDLSSNNEIELQNSILTIIEESLESIPLDVIHRSIVHSIPICESTRLMALGTMYKFPIKSLEYLFSYTTLVKFEDSDDSNLLALLTVIKELVKALITEKYKFVDSLEREQFIKNSNLFTKILSEYFNLEFKESTNPLTNLKRVLDSTTSSKTLIREEKVYKEIQKDWFL